MRNYGSWEGSILIRDLEGNPEGEDKVTRDAIEEYCEENNQFQRVQKLGLKRLCCSNYWS